MLKKFTELYKFPLLLAAFVAVVILAITVQKDPVQISFIILGSLGGMFFLDLDYILQTYFFEPESDFSKSVQGFIKHTDLNGLTNYIYYHKNDLKEKTLNSAIFQIVLAGACILSVSSTASNLVQALVISTFINSIYRLTEQHLAFKNTGDWFWAFKVKPDRGGLITYYLLLAGVLLLTFFLL